MPFRATLPARTALVIAAATVAFSAETPAVAGLKACATAQVSALATVFAESGAPVAGLTAADFIVREDNAKREIVRVDTLAEAPLFVTVIVDTSQPPMGSVPPVSDMRNSIAGFITAIRAANPGAQVSLMEVGGNASVAKVKFDAPATELDEAVARLFPNQMGDGVILQGITDASGLLKNAPTIRRAILSIDFNSPEGSADLTMRKAVAALQESQTALWAVSVRGSKDPSSKREAGLISGTEFSGGMRLTAVAASGLSTLLKKAADSLSSQYLVTYTRPDVDVKKIKMETTRGHKVLVGSLMR